MTRFIKWLLLSFALLLSPLFCWEAEAQTITAASCSQANVQAAINSAVPGNTVIVPAGTCSWTGLSISGISLIGSGKSATTGTIITAGQVTITKHASQLTRLSGFRFTGTDAHFTVSGATNARAFIIDNNYFFISTAMTVGANGGVIHHNDFFMPTCGGCPGPDALLLHPNEDWSQATTFGNADTQGPFGGERNIYIEDNTFTNMLESAPDGDQGARVVIRHNQYTDSSIVFHGGGGQLTNGNDTSTTGHRQYEVYNNTFSRVISNNDVNKWIWSRGAAGVIANNTMDIVDTQDFPNKTGIILGIGCPNLPPYPIPYQQGQSIYPPVENTPSHPVLIFGNTGPGSANSGGYTFLALQANNTGGGGHDCSSPSTYIQQNRDYYLSNHWNWTPFTYPHPLNLGPSSGNGPVPPQGLTASVH